MKSLIFLAVFSATVALAGCNQAQPDAMARQSAADDSASAAAVDAVPDGVAATNAVIVNSAIPKAAGATSTPPRFAATLPSEKTVIDGAGLSVAKVTRIIKTNDFSKFINRLSNESAADPLAQDVTVLERARWEKQLNGKAQLRDFACGLSVCAGRIDLGPNTAVYDTISDNFLKDGSQAGSLLDYRLSLGKGNFEQRFVLSHDPKVAGLTFSGRPPSASQTTP